MHELSIVRTIIEQVEQEIRTAGHDGRVLQVELSIGRLSGVHADAIEFAFEMLAPGTRLKGATLAIDRPKAQCCCSACDARTDIEGWPSECPACGDRDFTIEGGREMLLRTIELEDS